MTTLDAHIDILRWTTTTLNPLSLAVMQAVNWSEDSINNLVRLNAINPEKHKLLSYLRSHIHEHDERIIYLIIQENLLDKIKDPWYVEFLIEGSRESLWDCAQYDLIALLHNRFDIVKQVWEIKKITWEGSHSAWVWAEKMKRLKQYALWQGITKYQWKNILIPFFNAIHEEAIRIEKEIIES